ncbi:MAG: glycosyltransferase family 2 protein [Gaiella sp.]|nr:glycosyltransferase family 2 protein [Gaiella sp.]
MTLRTRDHEDVVGAQLAYHLSSGVDFVVATDHLSRDTTRDVLREFERAGLLELHCKDEERYEPGAWVNDMARVAYERHGADWVIHADADEFWWPLGGDLKAVLDAVPARYGALFGVWRHFAPRPEDGSHFAERMTVRLAAHGPWTSPEHPFHPNVNVIHRGDPDVLVRPGNHDLVIAAPVLRGWFPIEVLHFPLRTLAQAQAKIEAWGRALAAPGDVGPHVGAAHAALHAGSFRERYERYVVRDDQLPAGLAAGTLAVDTRVRDALRGLAGERRDRPLVPGFRFGPEALGARAAQPAHARHGVAAAADLAGDVSVLPDPADRVRSRVAELERRLTALERRPRAEDADGDGRRWAFRLRRTVQR